MIMVPTLLVDEHKCRSNIKRMAEKAKRNNLEFRPHFKTHQSHEIGNWFRDEGVRKITCSSLSMAKYFSEDGWDDITVAFPVNVLEIETINRLAAKIKLNLLFESIESVEILARDLKYPINAFIKLDLGTNRTGIDPSKVSELKEIIEVLANANKINFIGFLGHAGHSYGSRGKSEILKVHEESMNLLAKLKSEFPEALISYGDTPTCSIAEAFDPVDELRPGNFCFYDLMQWQIGSCSEEQIAVAMACPVVAKHPDRNEVVIYGGGVHFSKDSMILNGDRIFGILVEDHHGKWGSMNPEILLDRVSQEHGIIKAPSEWINQLRIGEVVKILPVHSCMTMDLLRTFEKV